jgi:hypothetical protein
MNYNLNCLRENYCRPATIVGKTMHHLFPLERECDQGRIVRAKAPEQLLHLQELDPRGLEQTYRDEASGAELPVFAVFNLEGDHRCTFEIAPESVPKNADPASLQAHIPFTKTQAFVRKINERRIKAQRLVALMCVMLVCLPATVYLVLLTIEMVLGGLLAYIVSVSVLDRVCPWIELFITAEFEGILPREARERARTAKDQFDNLYLIVDQQNRWKSTLLPDPSRTAFDPLLIAELGQGQKRKFFVIHQFDLSTAERYLTDEFVTQPG